MSEKPPKTPPSEQLRQSLLKEALEGLPSHLKKTRTGSSTEQVRTIAAVIPGVLNHFSSLESGDPSQRRFSRLRLNLLAANCDFSSLNELKSALFELRDQTKKQLPKKERDIWFDVVGRFTP